MATFIKYQDELQQKGHTATSTASRLTSTLCRIVNVVFSEQFVDKFLSVNDRMSRRDHETKKTFKSFWIKATLTSSIFQRLQGQQSRQQRVVLPLPLPPTILATTVTMPHLTQTTKRRITMLKRMLLLVLHTTTVILSHQF